MTKKLLIILLIVVIAAGVILGYFWWQVPKGEEPRGEPESKKEGIEEPQLSEKGMEELLSMCEKMTNEKLRKACFALVNKEPNRCEEITGDFKQTCYNLLAIRMKDPAVCDKLQDSEAQGKCKAYAGKNPSACEILKGEYYRGILEESDLFWCYYYYAVKNKDPEICKRIGEIFGEGVGVEISTEKELVERCISGIGIFNGNEDLCGTTDEFCRAAARRDVDIMRTYQLEFFDPLSIDVSLCEREIPKGKEVSEEMDWCYFEVVKSKLKLYHPEGLSGVFLFFSIFRTIPY